MPHVYLGNFDFEHELAGAPSTSLQISEMFWAWLPMADAQDVLLAPSGVDDGDFLEFGERDFSVPRLVHDLWDLDLLSGLELVPWGWTSSAVEFGRSHGWRCPAPPLDVVRKVNSREYRFALETELKIGLPGAALATSVQEMGRAIEQLGNAPRGWLLKANFGMSGREAVRGRGKTLDEETRNWALKRIAQGPIVCQPGVERAAEAGIQIEIPEGGRPQLIGVTPLLVDQTGVYRGSRFGCPAGELGAWQPAAETGLRVAETIQRLGYFGPLGIDAM